MPNDLYLRMKEFFEVNPVTRKLAGPLKEGAVAELAFDGDATLYAMVKEGGRSVLRPGRPEHPEMVMKFNKGAIDYIFGLESEKVEDYALRLFECAVQPTQKRWVRVKLTTSILDAYRKGYIAMLLLGGPGAVKMAAQLGIKIPAKYVKKKRGKK